MELINISKMINLKRVHGMHAFMHYSQTTIQEIARISTFKHVLTYYKEECINNKGYYLYVYPLALRLPRKLYSYICGYYMCRNNYYCIISVYSFPLCGATI